MTSVKSALIGHLVSKADRYCDAAGVSRASISKAIFGRGGHIDDLQAGKRDLSTSVYERAMRWLQSHLSQCPESKTDSPAGSSAGDAGASLPPSDAPASLSQDRAAVAQLVHTQQVAGSNPAPATSFQSPDILPSGVTAGARRKDDAGRAPASSVLGSAAQ